LRTYTVNFTETELYSLRRLLRHALTFAHENPDIRFAKYIESNDPDSIQAAQNKIIDTIIDNNLRYEKERRC